MRGYFLFCNSDHLREAAMERSSRTEFFCHTSDHMFGILVCPWGEAVANGLTTRSSVGDCTGVFPNVSKHHSD